MSTAEWLDQCLHARGVNAELPYDADVKWTVRQHLLDLVAVKIFMNQPCDVEWALLAWYQGHIIRSYTLRRKVASAG